MSCIVRDDSPGHPARMSSKWQSFSSRFACTGLAAARHAGLPLKKEKEKEERKKEQGTRNKEKVITHVSCRCLARVGSP
jgi:hypothetical protein